jgi:hypothetical protein
MFALLIVVAVIAAVRGMWSPCGLSMLTALNPMAEGARGHRFGATASWYLAGAAVGGGVLGGCCGLAALAVDHLHWSLSLRWTIALGAAVAAVLSDARIGGWSLPDHPRQVDDRWLREYRRWIYASGFGFQIGTGFATYIMTAAVYLTAVLAALTAHPGQALTAGLVFGCIRGLAILIAAPVRDPDRLGRVAARVDAGAGISAFVAMGAGVGAATTAGWSLAGPALAGGICLALLGITRLPTMDLSAFARERPPVAGRRPPERVESPSRR